MELLSDKVYPEDSFSRRLWVNSLRPDRNVITPHLPVAAFLEPERSKEGVLEDVATLLLANKECTWKCVMCDLWKNTLKTPLEPGVIPRQIQYALNQLFPNKHSPGLTQVIKLYNSGSFFDSAAILSEDLPIIADLVRGFTRVIVECHPKLVGPRCLGYRDAIAGQLEIAMGLETVHPEALSKLNKGIDLLDFQVAAQFLHEESIDMRAFVLLNPPFIEAKEALQWCERSISYAFDQGATAVSIIPVRANNGAMEALARLGHYFLPSLGLLEAALDFGVKLGKGRVFADLWELDRFVSCQHCANKRMDRLRRINFSQRLIPHVVCEFCGRD